MERKQLTLKILLNLLEMLALIKNVQRTILFWLFLCLMYKSKVAVINCVERVTLQIVI